MRMTPDSFAYLTRYLAWNRRVTARLHATLWGYIICLAYNLAMFVAAVALIVWRKEIASMDWPLGGVEPELVTFAAGLLMGRVLYAPISERWLKALDDAKSDGRTGPS